MKTKKQEKKVSFEKGMKKVRMVRGLAKTNRFKGRQKKREELTDIKTQKW